ncbi:MAG: cytochrome b N-terminal domain-containing protein [Chloroflexi bacterium]|nr:cytochrome b N-terminal domain-containing protein [Chloroflexota bacterium]
MRKTPAILVIIFLISGLLLVLLALSGSSTGGNINAAEARAYIETATPTASAAMPAMPGMDDHAQEATAESTPSHDADHSEIPPTTDHGHAAGVDEDAAAHDADHGDSTPVLEADHIDTAAAAGEEAHGHDEAEDDGHGHGAPRIGYIGLEGEGTLDEQELEKFVERVQNDAYKKGDLDQFRFVVFGLFFAVTYVAFAKIKTGDLSNRLKNAIDWHTLGTASGIILIFLVIPSGVIITFYFMPTSTGVYSSVENMADQPVLAFFRNLHNWSSEIFMFLSLLHAARTVSTRTFLGKRKLIWVLGALAFVVSWIAFLSGTFMRGDQEALEGFEHMMYSFSLVPLGRTISDFFTGEFTLMKLTALHVGVTIFIIALTVTLHVLMRKVHVLVTRRWKKAVAYSLALTLFLVVQSVLMEAPFVRGLESGPTVSGIEATKPPWPIYFLIQGENWFGANAMVAILAVAFIPLIIFPYVVEFLPLSPAKKARAGEFLFYAGVFLMIVVSYIAAAGEIQAHIFM